VAATQLSEIELATLAPGATKASEPQNFDETWKGEIYTESSRTVAYIKMLPSNRLISEVACALLGHALGLNMPKPYLVRVDRADLPQSNRWLSGETSRLCFGSEDAKHPSFRRLVNPNNSANVSGARITPFWKKLTNWAGFKRTALFDEWTANCDRNGGNVLWDGIEAWLIDHANAFTGPNWTPSDLRPDATVPNLLLDPAYIRSFSQDEKLRWKQAAGQESSRYQQLELNTLSEKGMLEDYADQDQINGVVHFVTKRAENFIELACNRLGIPLLI